MILGLVFQQVCSLDTLRNDTKPAVGRLLDPIIHIWVLGRQNEKHQLRSKFIGISGGIEEVHHRICTIVTSIENHWVSVHNGPAVAPVGSDELLNERCYSLFRGPVKLG